MKKGKFLTDDDLHLAETDKHQKTSSRKSQWKWKLAFYVVLFLAGMFVGMSATNKEVLNTEKLTASEEISALEEQLNEYKGRVNELEAEGAMLKSQLSVTNTTINDLEEQLAEYKEQLTKESVEATPLTDTPNPSSETEEVQPQRTATASPPIQQPTESPASTPPVTAQYEIFIEPRMLDDSNVEVFITTNIPGSIEVMADLSLAGQAPSDVWIGTNKRVSVRDGEGIIILDGSELPAGEYDVEVSFYPRWGFKDNVSRQSGLDREIHVTTSVTLTGSGESVEDVRRRNEGRRWVMSNFRMGQKWDPAFWVAKFGEWKQLVVDYYNPAIIKAYYFASIDMTLMVNVLEGTIDTWRDGKWEHGP